MTPEEATALARRAIACPRWRWMPGMRWIVERAGPLEDLFGRVPDDTRGWAPQPRAVPDLADPATLGCLLAMYDETRTILTIPDPVYTLAASHGLRHPRTTTAVVTMTIAALVAALERAP
jgi:hypothetical protein